ncbi:TPA: hypothetical protein I7730_01495 [Vibrio vulnificus]|uniref:Cadherin domain-containing protein n=1 Tax=Vibrio vulnificus TaxID=672 RepID=A0A8H9MY92_VIBVL|nr:hypothetical protein [Vibrio vulnificus]
MRFSISAGLLTALILSSVPTFATTPSPPAVDGQISNLAELRWLSQNSSAWTKDWVLTADIDAGDTINWNDGQGFLPIGTESQRYSANFDGGGYTISNLYIDRPEQDQVGLFGYITFSNYTLSNLTLDGANITGRKFVGSFAGTTYYTTLANLSVKNSQIKGVEQVGGVQGVGLSSSGNDITVEGALVEATGSSRDSLAGGFSGTGTNLAEFHNINITAVVKSNYRAGGVVGLSENGGDWFDVTLGVDVSAPDAAGGFVGFGRNIEIDGLYGDVKVTGEGTGYYSGIGGVVGYSGSISRVHNCELNVDVTGTLLVGGIFGSVASSGDEVKNCSITGNVAGAVAVGGLAGLVSSASALFTDVSINSNSSISGTEYVGGLFGITLGGYDDRNYVRLSSSAKVSGVDKVGGFTGTYLPYWNLIFTQSYFDGELSSGITSGGMIGYVQSERIRSIDQIRGYLPNTDAANIVIKDSYSSPLFLNGNEGALISPHPSIATFSLDGSYVSIVSEDPNTLPDIPLYIGTPLGSNANTYVVGGGTSVQEGISNIEESNSTNKSLYSGFDFTTPWSQGVWVMDMESKKPVLSAEEVPLFTAPSEADGNLPDLKLEVGESHEITVNAYMASAGTDDGVTYELVADKEGIANIDEYGQILIEPTSKEHAGELNLSVMARHGAAKNYLDTFKVDVVIPDNTVDGGNGDSTDGGGNLSDGDNSTDINIHGDVNISGGSTAPVVLIMLVVIAIFRIKHITN